VSTGGDSGIADGLKSLRGDFVGIGRGWRMNRLMALAETEVVSCQLHMAYPIEPEKRTDDIS
jgi:hypothetical protein